MVKVVIVNGMPESGKTTAQNICKDILKLLSWDCVIESSVDWVKDIAKYAGWNGVKDDKSRRFLSELKSALTNWDDAILRHLIAEVDNYYYTGRDFVFFIDIREPKEIEKARKVFNASTLLIRRPDIENNTYSNSSDMGVFDYQYDYTIWNDKSLDILKSECANFLGKLIVNNKFYNGEGKV